MSVEHLRFASDILSRLGEELISDPDQGIIEIVRNSYDADATKCEVTLNNTEGPGGSIVIVDNGDGMTTDAIKDGWLVVGRSAKAANRITPKGRRVVGDKGLGRLAALRMGSKATLVTRPRSEPGTEHRITINWDDFDSTNIVEQVPLTINTSSTEKKSGTEVHIEGLRSGLSRSQTENLAKAIILLSDPFDSKSSFRASLRVPGHKDLEAKVKDSYFDESEFYLEANLDAQGMAKATVKDWKGKVIWKASHKDLAGNDKPYVSVPASFELWVFNLGSDSKFSGRKIKTTEVRNWLKTFGSVHLYHNGLRVRPYGDPGQDWLELNLARVRSPELRPSTNNSLGRVFVDDEENRLVQKTDRMGFIENEIFNELKQFAVDAADWLAAERHKYRESKRANEKATAKKSAANARKSLETVLSKNISKKAKPEVTDAIKKFITAVEKEKQTLREDLQLYRTLATAGTTSAVFAHESGKPITNIITTSRIIESRAKKISEDTYTTKFDQPLGIIRRSAEALRSFASLPLHFLKRDKRRASTVDVNATLTELTEFFRSFLEESKIEVSLELASPSHAFVEGTTALIEGIVANLITNAVNAFNSEGNGKSRNLLIRTEVSGDFVLIKVLDNGPGITKLSVDDIWLPGKTSLPSGTGLGLTIVKDSAEEMNGSVHVLANGELGGAEFTIKLPAAKER